MIRTQIQLTEAQSCKIREAARQAGVSAAEIVRRSIDRYLEREATAAPATEGRLSALKVVGLFHSGLHDVASRHDEYLDEVYLPRPDR